MRERNSLRRAGRIIGGFAGALFGYVVGMEQNGALGAIAGVVLGIPVGAVLGPYAAYLFAAMALLVLVPLVLAGLAFYVVGLAIHDVLRRKE
jgi:hypothetical protein